MKSERDNWFMNTQSQQHIQDPGRRLTLNAIWDICSMMSLVIKGRNLALEADDLPSSERTPTTFSLTFDDATAVAALIDDKAAKLRNDVKFVAHRRHTVLGFSVPMIVKYVLSERFDLLAGHSWATI
jgi:hypothetical protein